MSNTTRIGANKMKLHKYQKRAVRTLNPDLNDEEQIKNMLMGIQGETGEVADLFKKHFYQGHPLHYKDVAEEIGDVMFYIVNLCTLMGLDLERVLTDNHDKLLKRYPDGFSKDNSLNRD